MESAKHISASDLTDEYKRFPTDQPDIYQQRQVSFEERKNQLNTWLEPESGVIKVMASL
ncbi:hypothetical protein OKW21_005167 [Catalinimonas alkaloidigena]|uniref:hypothetical protein n=1 Tax=Catalinimonas alkaloidigena TaxID=1075417 RepID=UPI0024060C2B|nr:hypothetical protein [Catalinimonas alkaloidigena]MDF9799904.1 hypothetical protein [Catalinimonas alkaloidigena]